MERHLWVPGRISFEHEAELGEGSAEIEIRRSWIPAHGELAED